MTDLRYQYTELAAGAGHPTKADNINRLTLAEHNPDGTHKDINADSFKTKGPWIDVTHPDYGAKGDGVTDDTAAIQAAIDSLTNGGVVFLPPNSFKISSALRLADGVHLLGSGYATYIDATSVTGAGISISGVTGFSVCNLRLESDVSTSGSHGIRIEGGVDGRISNCWLVHADGDVNVANIAIDRLDSPVTASRNIVIENNIFRTINLAVLLQSAGSTYSENIVISNNIVDFIASTSTVSTGVIKVDHYARNVSITGNTCYGNGKAMYMIQGEEDVDALSITGNSLYNVSEIGIHIFKGQTALPVRGLTISGNVIKNGCSLAGIRIDPDTTNIFAPVVNGNSIYNITGMGIDGQGADSINAASITANVIEGCSTGIRWDGAQAAIVGNSIKDSTSYGIRLNSSSAAYCSVTGNTIKDPGAQAITLSSGANNNVIASNTITASDAHTTDIGVFGTATNNIVVGNRVTTVSPHGIIIDTNATGCLVQHNIITGATTAGINNLGSAQIRDNIGYVTENYGNASISPNANGNGTIAHGLVSTPSSAVVGIRGDNVNGVDVESVDGTNITVRIKDASGADVTAGSFTIDWDAKV